MDSQPAIDTFAALADLARDVQARGMVLQEQRRLLDVQPYLIQKFSTVATNLAAYIALRRHELRELQSRLSTYGLSSLGRSEAQVMHNLDNVLQAIRMMLGEQPVRRVRNAGNHRSPAPARPQYGMAAGAAAFEPHRAHHGDPAQPGGH